MPALSVGPPYFRPSFLLPVLPLLALAAIGLHANWKRGRLSEKKQVLLTTLGIAAVLALAMSFGVFAGRSVMTPVGFTLGCWIALSSLFDPLNRLRRQLSFSRGVLGMTVAHIGLAIFVIAITAVESFTQERDLALARGASVELGAYEVRFVDLRPLEGPNYGGVRGEFLVKHAGKTLMTLYPAKRQYWVQRQVMTEAGIGAFRGGNVLIALGEDLGNGRWSLRVQIRPLVNFVWIGAFVMALGGALAASDKRYRVASRTVPDTAVTGRRIAAESTG